MTVRRIVPDFQSADVRGSVEFYSGLLGLEQVMDHGWIVTLADPNDPARQLSVASHDASAPVVPDVSVEVDDVDATYRLAQQMGAEIVHPLTDEPWGVRRFFVKGPEGHIVNVLGHP
ncbi:VOC family protein [Glycomyces sp. TRM65418]|uniref:VOC family protein n=1 Tax=Glycomyces sp. TRM65418 TaxID=2867006 RepID=UPI001CE636AB|nr:VOC family protein [Glycomyces sp. TRM65418]MCC3764205.1 VOC family protein [Glycomyces sp. TRM65418]QZD53889.1 VOC family protein [Glycomyces sp. TRM65418]